MEQYLASGGCQPTGTRTVRLKMFRRAREASHET